jgi:CubicO group peptidase (beta-lactamase class C family)
VRKVQQQLDEDRLQGETLKTSLKRIVVVLSLVLLANSATGAVLPDKDIRAILADRIDAQHQGVGIAVGVIEPSGRRVVAYGSTAKEGRPVDANTVFEIGSVTKVFTALLLADAVKRGEVALTDPVSKYLPPDVKVPERGGKKITLVDLSTHTSGLPRLPSNFYPKDPGNPYADYTVPQLYEFLSTLELTRDVGSQYEYSNLGGGLLGHALARRAGTDYETLVRTRILEPLGMKSTAITLSKSMNEHLTPGHDARLQPVPNWDFPTLAGAGALRSTANDLLTFLAANIGLEKSPLANSMAAMIPPRRPTGMPNLEIALGWHIWTRDGREIIWHDGGTGGYRTWIGFELKTRTGVVVLSNTSTDAAYDIGLHLLDPAFPLLQPPKQRQEVKVDAAVLEKYTGRYQLAPNFIITITRDGDQLYAQITGQPRAEIFAESEREFFYKVVDAQLTFVVDANGRGTSIVLHQNGADHPAKRMEGEPPPAKVHKEIAVDPKIFDGYAGRYQLAPNLIQTITRDGDRLYAQATGQPRFEIFAEGARDFFYKDFDAQMTFVVDANGRATALVHHQNGTDYLAKRLEGEPPPAKEHKEIAVDPKIFDGYAGRYQLAPNFIITITREGDQLSAQATNQPRAEIFAESEREFFYKVVDAQFTFVVDANGRATSVVLHQNGRNMPGNRIRERQEVKVDAAVLEKYVGRYQLAPDFIITVTREGDQLYAQATNQQRAEIFAESEREFFYKVVDAQITFVVDANGRATSVVLHQNGNNNPGNRIE